MKHISSQHHTKNGFTLIELLVAATIIIVLTTIGVVSYRAVSISSRDAKRKSDLETVRQAMVMYRSEHGEYPDGDFNGIVIDLYNDDYLTEGSFSDPSTGVYEYDSGTKTLKATLEKDGEYNLRLP